MKKLLLFALVFVVAMFRAQDSESVASKRISEISKEDLKGFFTKEDKFENIVFITPTMVNNNSRYGYLVLDGDQLFFRYKINYSGYSWIFANKIIFLYDGERYEIPYVEPKTEVFYGSVGEFIDFLCTPETIDVFRKIAVSKQADYRLEGTKGNSDSKFSNGSKKDLLKILSLYDKLKK
ncbi:MAG: hypothetical protein LBE36_06305 [Flavobacteriaceae bacterium]|jgi:hypothetical protein|nr:hypothetical protein [Flavobacteriaceae bacterium]